MAVLRVNPRVVIGHLPPPGRAVSLLHLGPIGTPGAAGPRGPAAGEPRARQGDPAARPSLGRGPEPAGRPRRDGRAGRRTRLRSRPEVPSPPPGPRRDGGCPAPARPGPPRGSPPAPRRRSGAERPPPQPRRSEWVAMATEWGRQRGRRGPSRLRSAACGRAGSGRPPGQPRGRRERSGRMEDGFSSYSSLYDTSSLLQFCNGKGGGQPRRAAGSRRSGGAEAEAGAGKAASGAGLVQAAGGVPAAQGRPAPRRNSGEETSPPSASPLYGGKHASPRGASASNFCTSFMGICGDTCAYVDGVDACVHLSQRQIW